MELKLAQPLLAQIGLQKYKVSITWRNGRFIADEPENLGGKDLGPDPFSLLLASLAACTLSTLRMYIDRKQWDITNISVELNFEEQLEENSNKIISRKLIVEDKISEEQRLKLIEIANKCPISRLLESSVQINSSIN